MPLTAEPDGITESGWLRMGFRFAHGRFLFLFDGSRAVVCCPGEGCRAAIGSPNFLEQLLASRAVAPMD